MDFFEVMKNRDVVTDEAETTEYFEKTQEIRTQYESQYEYNQKITSESTKNILDQSLILKGRVTTLADIESSNKKTYDYENFKIEYEQQLEYNMKHGKVLNYTEREELEDTPKEALKRIINLKRSKNCTKEELSQIGIKALECLLYDYQRVKDITHVNKILSRTWLVLKIWLLIYICLAIPCWCQRGWCCCCFRCKFCFPQKKIIFTKQYYTMNPPGTFVKDLKKEKDMRELIKYEVTEDEYNAYKTFETAIKNI
ncbi:uncharacterized protein [Anoplolepis gracilipes]|uniref:uncharacterized protein n=1 Tax=Anoplolepis gracilipes TaxID=354296 RepID=UPI003BA1A646